MRMLMIVRKVDRYDASPAGFTYHWIEALAKKVEQLKVICLTKGEVVGLLKLGNVKIYSLDKQKYSHHSHIIRRLALLYNFQKLGWSLIRQVDIVFCHQNPEYTILIAPMAKLFRKKIITWYAHGYVGWKLHMVNWLADKILTSSFKGCRLKNKKKIEVIGQGIDVSKFQIANNKLQINSKFQIQDSRFKILTVGRISPAKDYETLIEAIEILVRKGIKLEVSIIGGVGLPKHEKYLADLKKTVRHQKLGAIIKFKGPVAHREIVEHLQETDLFVNLGQTGSLDKAVLEAMACEKLVLTCNEAYIEVLRDSRLLFEKKNPQDLANKIINLLKLPETEKEKIGEELRQKVNKNHSLDNLIEQIIKISSKLCQ